jgi:ABC-2 type transport system permease protein
VTSARALSLVVARELRQAMRRKSFWITIAIALLATTAAVVLPEVLGGHRTTYTVGLVDVDSSTRAALKRTEGVLDADLTLRALPDQAAARRAVDDSHVTIAVVGGPEPKVIARAGHNEQLVAAAQEVLARERLTGDLVDAGLSERAASRAVDQPTIKVQEQQAGQASRRGGAALISLALYLMLLMLTIQVANGTAIEKANRISEVLLAIVRPAPLLFGKVVAVGLIGAMTLLAGAVPVLIKAVAGGDLPAGLLQGLAAGAAWFVLGVALYLTLAGALGALVERQEEAGSVVAPLSIVLIASYLIGQSAPESTLGAVLSILPLTSTMVMPARIAVGAATPAEIAASLVLGVVAVVLTVRFGATVYRRAIVRTGRRLKLGDVLRTA